MKKLYKKGKVHPSPPLISDHLAFLPATILTLAAALTPEDREVLAYLLSCSTPTPTTTTNKKTTTTHGHGAAEHPPLFYCNCFRCYTSYWVRWDSSPNRQLIHDIIDAFEDELTQKKKKMKNKKDRKKKRCSDEEVNLMNTSHDTRVDSPQFESVAVNKVDDGGSHSEEEEEEEEGGEFEKGSVRKFVSFIGETIWGVWN